MAKMIASKPAFATSIAFVSECVWSALKNKNIGVIFYLLHSPTRRHRLWPTPVVDGPFGRAWAMRRQATDTPVSCAPDPLPLRVAHGSSALLIVLLFLLAYGEPREREKEGEKREGAL